MHGILRTQQGYNNHPCKAKGGPIVAKVKSRFHRGNVGPGGDAIEAVYVHNVTQYYGQYMIWRCIFNQGYCREMMPNDGEQPTWMHGKRLRSRMATFGSMNLPKNTLPETNIAPEDRVGPKRNGFYSKNPFLRCELLVSDVSGRKTTNDDG